MERDERNRKGKGEGKHGYSATEQKRIDEIKLKKAVAREVTLQNLHQKPKKEEDSEAKEDHFFGQKMTKKLKAKMQKAEDEDW